MSAWLPGQLVQCIGHSNTMSILQKACCAQPGHGPQVKPQQHASRRLFLSTLPGLIASSSLAPVAAAIEGVQAPPQPTIFQKRIMACAASKQMLEAARAVAEFEICSNIDSAQACAIDSRSSSLKRQVSVMYQAAGTLRDTLPSMAAQAVRRGPPPPNSLEVLLNLAASPAGSPDQLWSNKVFNQQRITDEALANMQNQANALLRDPSGAVDWERLVDFANSIKVSREVYNQWVALVS